jgi:diguanylate cyclase (GGDEF)-like protein/PAS domain S-box-containing protein
VNKRHSDLDNPLQLVYHQTQIFLTLDTYIRVTDLYADTLEQEFINLLVIDHSLASTEQFLAPLRDAGYLIQLSRAEQENELDSLIPFKALDLIILHPGDDRPDIAALRTHLEKAKKDVPILVAVDDFSQQKPLDILRAGADNLFAINEPEHLLLVVRKELHYRRLRTQAHSYQQQIKETEARSRILLEHTGEAIAYIHEGAHILVNAAYARLFGFDEPQDLLGITLMDIVARDDHDTLKGFLRNSVRQGQTTGTIEVSGVDRQGGIFPIVINCTPTRINDEPGLQLVIQNPERQAELPGQGLYMDPVTGLNNRAYFINHVDQLLNKDHQRLGAVLYILLNNHRTISQDNGLLAGDILLRDIAAKLTAQLSNQEVCARLADAVITILTPINDTDELTTLAHKLATTVADNTSYYESTLLTTDVAIGICPATEHHQNAFQLLSQANEACESARQKNSTVEIYRATAHSSQREKDQESCWLLEDALNNRRVSALYLPIVSFQGDGTPRYDVRVKITDSSGKPLDLSSLADAAERTQAMLPLDQWLISHTLQAITQRQAEGHSLPTLFIDVSGNVITEKSFANWLKEQLDSHDLNGSQLVLTTNEQRAERFFKDLQLFREQLKTLNCRFGLTQFGSGEHSERLLEHLSPDYVLLDSELIERSSKSRRPRQRDQIATLTQRAQAMDVGIIASNVTTANQMASIWQYGAALASGSMVHEPGSRMDFDFSQFGG